MANLLFLLNSYPGLGGIEAVTTNLIDALGVDNDIYILAYDSTPGFSLPPKVREAFYFPDRNQSGAQEENIAFYNRILYEKNISHVIDQGMYPFLLTITFNPGRNKNVRIISALHGAPGYERHEYWFYRSSNPVAKFFRPLSLSLGLHKGYKKYVNNYLSAYRKAVCEGDKVVLLCDRYIDEFCRLYSIDDKEKICAIPNPLSASYSSCQFPDLDGKEKCILYVGRLSVEKNIQTMLDAWKMAQPRLPGWSFKIVGDGPLRKKLEAYVHNRNLLNVEFVGAVADPSFYYKKAKMLLLASAFEGFGMVLIEAQRFGVVPVAYPSSSGVASILENGGGVELNGRKADVIADTISRLAADENGIKSLAVSAYEKSDRYKLDNIAGQWRNVLSGLNDVSFM